MAVDDAAAGVENVNKINIIVLANDSDADGDTLTVTNLTQPSNGSVVLKGDFTVDYFPDSGFTGVVTFTYTANDGTGDSNTVTVTVTVSTAPNNLPVAVDDTASGEKNVNKINIIVLSNDSDADSDVMSVTNLTSPSNGSVVLKGDQTVDYFPDAGFAGVDTFTYTANDGTGDSGAATVTITVNAAPVAVADAATTAVNAAVTVTVLGNDTDANSDTLTVTNLTQPTNGSASVNGNNTVTYTPDSAFAGADTFTYTANDGRVDSNVATVTITVNAAPVAVNDADTTSVDVAVTVNVLGNDTDANSDTLTVTNLIQPSNGSASVNGDNTVTYTPNTGWTGTDTFTYKANDGTVDSANPATVTITVSASSVETVTLNVTEGWNSKDSKNLSTQLLLTNIQTSNDVWFDKDMSGGAPAYFISLEFDQTVPSGATITSVKVYIEHWENNGFLDGELAWEVGGGTLSSPSSLQSTTPTILLGSGNEAVVEWDVTSSIDTAAEANDLKVKITNNSTVGKKNSVDHVYVVVEYTE